MFDPWTDQVDGIPGTFDMLWIQYRSTWNVLHSTKVALAQSLEQRQELVGILKQIQSGELDPDTLMVTDEGVKRLPKEVVHVQQSGETA